MKHEDFSAGKKSKIEQERKAIDKKIEQSTKDIEQISDYAAKHLLTIAATDLAAINLFAVSTPNESPTRVTWPKPGRRKK